MDPTKAEPAQLDGELTPGQRLDLLQHLGLLRGGPDGEAMTRTIVNGLVVQWCPSDPVRQRLATIRAKINRRKPARFRRP